VDRNLTDIVDVVFVSDHGMTDTSHPELVYIDDILGDDGWQAVKHEDGGVLPASIVIMSESDQKSRLAFYGASLRSFGRRFSLS
jgi:predicted AlkP superfamily pyrophosphatase or phosphodiesterase